MGKEIQLLIKRLPQKNTSENGFYDIEDLTFWV